MIDRAPIRKSHHSMRVLELRHCVESAPPFMVAVRSLIRKRGICQKFDHLRNRELQAFIYDPRCPFSKKFRQSGGKTVALAIDLP